MKGVAAFVVAGLLTLTLADDLTALPKCARQCVTSFTSGEKIGNCPNSDAKCICSSQSFLGDIACCLAAACNADDQQTAVAYAASLCKISGVTGLPSSVSCSTAVTASSTSASSSTTASVTTTSTSGTTTSSLSGSSTTAFASSSARPSSTGNRGSRNIAGVGIRVLGAVVAVAAL